MRCKLYLSKAREYSHSSVEFAKVVEWFEVDGGRYEVMDRFDVHDGRHDRGRLGLGLGVRGRGLLADCLKIRSGDGFLTFNSEGDLCDRGVSLEKDRSRKMASSSEGDLCDDGENAERFERAE